MGLILSPGDCEWVDIGESRVLYRTKEGRVRIVIEGLSIGDVIRVKGVDVAVVKQQGSCGRTSTRMLADGPRQIPIKRTGIISADDEDYRDP